MFLEQDIVAPLLVPNTTAKTSVKPWAQAFNDLTNLTLHPPTRYAFDNVFGPMLLDDTTRIAQTVAQEPPRIVEFVKNEADVVRLFHRQISGVVLLYFTLMPTVQELDQSGPLGSTSFGGSVDTQFFHSRTQELLAIGEHKTPGVIRAEWSPARQTSETQELGRELRAYAYHYKCPQVFCYDGVRMLIVRLRAKDREDIKSCTGDMFVIQNTAGPGGIHIRYALYRLMVDGLHRLMAAIAPAVTIAHPVTTVPYTRHFDWFNGNPYWTVAGSNTKYSSDNVGVVRTPMQDPTGIWRWAWKNQNGWVAWCAQLF